MTKTLERALAEAATLPEAAQDQIGREVLAHIEKLRALRADIDAGLRSLDAGRGRALDIEDVIRRARRDDGG
jgi:predicted transcriptional regulator